MKPVFPGMDPYLESPGVWPGFHEAFLSYAREVLQPLLPERYYAEIKTREEIGIAGCRPEKVFYPDVSIKERIPDSVERDPFPGRSDSPATASVPEHLQILEEEPMQVSFLEIRETGQGDLLVTLIELLSPSNKYPGPDREAFLAKQREVLASKTNWIEIDLLRGGGRIGCHPSVEAHARRKGFDYLITVSRGTRRAPALDLELYGFTVRSPFPVIAVPLREPDPDVALDLGLIFRRAYETGPYRKILRYQLPPDPPLGPEDSAWAQGIVGESFSR